MGLVLAWCVGLIVWLAPAPFYAACAASVKDPAVNENFYGVEIVGNDAWIVGYYGTIFHSNDRGLTWELQSSPTRSALFKARFANRSTGWINGSYGTVLHTSDGGKNWRAQPSGTNEHLFGSFWLDENRGWVVGSRGTTLRTDDSGRSWRNLNVPGDFTFSAVSFVNETHGWLVGEFGVIFQTRNGGTSWLKQKSPVEVSFASGESRNLFALVFTDQNTGYSFGLDGLVLKTRDGRRWETARHGTNIDSRGGANHLFAATRFDRRIWAVGERGTLLQSDSEGNHWRQSESEIPRTSLNGIAFGKDGFGLVVGNRGIILRTENGGRTWQRLKITSQQSGKDNHHIP
jgi:photosystem II stability/assembly factor-like uncharacterized protein